MNKSEQSARVKAVRAYLQGIGAPISSVQGYEVLARGLGFSSKHVLSAKSEGSPEPQPVASYQGVPVMALTDEPFSVPRMRELGWKFDIIVPFALDQLDNGEMMNDYASKRITGNEAALESIGFDHIPDVFYGKGWVAYRVTGYVSAPEDLFDEESEAQEAQFYLDLKELADRIKGNVEVTIVDRGFATSQLLWRITAHTVQLLRTYAAEQGRNNDAVTRFASEYVFETRLRERGQSEVVLAARLGDLKYAHKVGPDTFEFEEGRTGNRVTLRFDN